MHEKTLGTLMPFFHPIIPFPAHLESWHERREATKAYDNSMRVSSGSTCDLSSVSPLQRVRPGRADSLWQDKLITQNDQRRPHQRRSQTIPLQRRKRPLGPDRNAVLDADRAGASGAAGAGGAGAVFAGAGEACQMMLLCRCTRSGVRRRVKGGVASKCLARWPWSFPRRRRR